MRWENQKDEATRLIIELISSNLWFHVATFKAPNEIWTTLESLFEKQDEMRGHMLEVELNTLDSKSFDNIPDFFTNFKYLILRLAYFVIDKYKQVYQLILTILSNLGQEYVVYVSTFHSGMYLMGTNWNTPTIDQFIDSLTHEQKKIVHMGLIRDPNEHALTMLYGKGSSKQNKKEK
jgi:hypothetical protein